MLKWFNKKKKDNKGFTLVELVVVVAILAILVGLLAPQYTKYVERSRKSADASNLENMVRAVEIQAADPSAAEADKIVSGTYSVTINEDGTSVNIVSDGTDVGKTAIENAIKHTINENALATKVKSRDWGTTKNGIVATIKVGSDYTVSVSYEPEKLETYVGKDKATSNPAPNPGT